jgi:hypothetical protein
MLTKCHWQLKVSHIHQKGASDPQIAHANQKNFLIGTLSCKTLGSLANIISAVTKNCYFVAILKIASKLEVSSHKALRDVL